MREHEETINDLSVYAIHQKVSYDCENFVVESDAKEDVLNLLITHGGDGEFWYPDDTITILDRIIQWQTAQIDEVCADPESTVEERRIVVTVRNELRRIRNIVSKTLDHGQT